MKNYTVCLYGSHPADENDDCHTGERYATLDEARAVFENPWGTFNAASNCSCTMYFELDGPGVNELRKNPDYKPRSRRDDDSDWKSEQAMQAGMAYGMDGYNDAMGYDREPPDRD